jgi:uncharacterized membrane protein YcfT
MSQTGTSRHPWSERVTRQPEAQRYDWVDAAKGICIILVVLMHSTLGVEKALGTETWMHAFIDWARPFRMPDFFLISGLFLASRIDRSWRAYLDTKVVHFAYFYVLWLTIQFALKAPGMVGEMGAAATLESYLWSFIDPFGTLWFIYLLAVFFVVSKLLRDVPKAVVIAGAVLLRVFAPVTGWVLLDEFSDRFVFFYTGYALAPVVFAFAERVAKWPALPVAAALAAWAALNAVAVQSGITHVRGPDFIFSFAGIAAVIAASVLLAGSLPGRVLAYCGLHSIAIYLAFTVFMGPTRVLMLKLGGAEAPVLVALAATLAGVVGSLVMRRLVAPTPLSFLFTRPKAFRLASSRPESQQNPGSRGIVEAAE